MRNSLKPVVLFLFAGVFVFSTKSDAQRFHPTSYEKGIFLVNLNTSIGLYKNKDFVTSRIPVFIGGDYGLTNRLSLGIYGGWSQRTLKPSGSLAFDVNYFYYGAQFSIHLTEWLGDNTFLKFSPRTVDIYATLYGGKESSRQVGFSGLYEGIGNITRFGGYLGVRMYTMYRIGILLEIGPTQYGLINLGICAKI